MSNILGSIKKMNSPIFTIQMNNTLIVSYLCVVAVQDPP